MEIKNDGSQCANRCEWRRHGVAAGGGVLGVFPMLSYSMGRKELRRDDRVIMFTDGISEAADASGEHLATTGCCNWWWKTGKSAPANCRIEFCGPWESSARETGARMQR